MIDVLPNLLVGVAAGAIRSVMGWLDSGKPFNAKLFVSTLVKTSLIGAAMAFAMPQAPISIFFQVYFADSLINKSYKIVRKKQ